MQKFLTGAEAGLSGEDQIRIALRTILENGGVSETAKIYDAVEQRMYGAKLSKQGKDSLRSFINRTAVRAGFIYPYDDNQPGWRITAKGREFTEIDSIPAEDAINADTGQTVRLPSNSAAGAAFESYILELLKKVYPDFAWYHQGIHKNNERGLDFIGNRVGDSADLLRSIGVQVKFHASNTKPSTVEWLKFLAGCYTRRVQHAIFITTGSLDSEQRREAGEAGVLVIEGRTEIDRIAQKYKLEKFKLDGN